MNHLIIFAKEPVAGRVKTRLAKDISDTHAMILYQSFLEDTLDGARHVDVDKRVLAWAAEGEPMYLKSVAHDFDFYQQEEGDLGARMHNAFVYAHAQGAQKTVIIGSDSPTLPTAFIEQAFTSLQEHDVVIGPSEDGGYYLIGLTHPDARIFVDTDWSVSTTREQTMSKIKQLDKAVHLLPQWFDVDTKDDLEQLHESLARDVDAGTHTRQALEKMMKV